jgi:tetratricopeptide (TPR) repeat protein
MLTRLLLFAALLSPLAAPLYAQDEDVTKYIDELRAPQPPRDVRADMQTTLTVLTQQLDGRGDAAQRASVYLRISDIEQSLDEPEAAIAAARNAFDLLPGDKKTALSLAAVLLKNGQTAEVPALLNINPADGEALRAKALSLGGNPVATYFAEQAHQLLAGDPATADALGQVYMRTGQSRKAIEAYIEAESLAPQVATFHYHAALANFQLGRSDGAQSELQLALDCNPTEAQRVDIQMAQARLNTPRKKQ